MNDFPKANSFDINLVRSKTQMGPNPLKLCEEPLCGVDLAEGSRVCDLGSGAGITSVMLAREYGFDVYGVDLWSDPIENRTFFRQMGVPDGQIHPVKADAAESLPFRAVLLRRGSEHRFVELIPAAIRATLVRSFFQTGASLGRRSTSPSLA